MFCLVVVVVVVVVKVGSGIVSINIINILLRSDYGSNFLVLVLV